jgi:flagellar hook protein FlgE
MIPSLHNGVSALKSVSDGLQVLGNNIANVGSLGYKSSRANYSDNFYMHINEVTKSGKEGKNLVLNSQNSAGTGVHLSSVSTNFNQGVLENTGLDLDLAIEGEALPNGGGFFEVEHDIHEYDYPENQPPVIKNTVTKTLYTRVGSFQQDKDGHLVTRGSIGAYLLDTKGERIKIEHDGDLLARRIEQDGSINLVVSINGQDKIESVGQIKLVNFTRPQYLKNEGNGYFSEPKNEDKNGNLIAPEEKGVQAGMAGKIENVNPGTGANGKIKQYALELSNVDLTNEFAMMITHQRAFQAGSRVVTTSDSILSEAVNLKR